MILLGKPSIDLVGNKINKMFGDSLYSLHVGMQPISFKEVSLSPESIKIVDEFSLSSKAVVLHPRIEA